MVNIDQVRTVEIGYRNNVKNKMLKESLMLTDDENIIDIQFAVQYILKDPKEFLFNQPQAGRHGAASGGNRNSRNRRQEQDGLRAV